MTNKLIKEITDGLKTKLDSLVVDEKELLEYYKFTSKFYQDRSFRNVLLIFMTKPNAEVVATYKQWIEKHNRIVVACIVCRSFKKNDCTCEKREKPTRINQLMPIVAKGKTEEEEDRVFFRAYNVFDIEDTEPLNEDGEVKTNPNTPTLLIGDDGVELMDSVKNYLESIGWSFEEELIRDGSNGYTVHPYKKVRIKKNNSNLQKAKTSVHELAHVLLHADIDYFSCRDLAEVQAESVAYIVCNYYGLNTDDYSIKYINGWSNGDDNIFIKSQEEIFKTSSEIIGLLT
jgi:hypothetical protein